MTLLQTLTLAAASADAGDLSPLSKFPTVLNSALILPNLRPSAVIAAAAAAEGGADPPADAAASPNAAAPPTDAAAPGASSGGVAGVGGAAPLTGWSIPPSDATIADLCSDLSRTLARKLSSPSSLTLNSFLALLNSFLIRTADAFKILLPLPPSDPAFTHTATAKLAFLIGTELAGLISDSCALHSLWDLLETVVLHCAIGNLNSTKLITKLIEKNQPLLLCLCVTRIPDLRSTDIVLILKCFLSPSFEGMVDVRKRWEGEGVAAIGKATEKGVKGKVRELAKKAAVLLMMGHDGFSSGEICLHYLFGGTELDELVLASAVSRIDGAEVLRLIRYLMKWLEKYERFPEAGPCREAVDVLGLRACGVVPSLEVVVGVLGLVLDEHYSYLVLNSKFHDEMRAVQRVVDALATEARACGPVDDIVKHLQSLKEESKKVSQ